MRRLRRQCERRLEGIPVPRPFNLDQFCQGIARTRGRRLQLQGVAGLSSTAPCGLWISVPAADYVFFDANTTPLHAEHIVLHELGHIVCQHTVDGEVEHSALARLMPDLDPGMIARVLGRVRYSTAQEQEAEMLASLIRANSVRGLTGPAGIGGRRDTLGRLADVLSFEP